MKKKLVAIVLSAAMCLATVFQAGAAEFGSPESVDVPVSEQAEDVFFDDAAPEEVTEEADPEVENEVPADVEAEVSDADIFSAGEVVTDVTEEEMPGEITDFDEPADAFSAGANDDVQVPVVMAGGIVVSAEDWVTEGENYRLRKAVAETTAETPVEEPAAADAEEIPAADLLSDGEEIPAEDGLTEDVQSEEEIPAAEAPSVSGYYTAEDGIVQITTEYKNVTHTGYYLFDENGYLVTGMAEVPVDTYDADANTEFYFREKMTAAVYAEFEGEEISPWTSNLGQRVINDWVWTGKIFEFYDEAGKKISITELDEIYKQTGKYTGYYKINGEYYCLKADGTPRVGNVTLTVGSSSARYYFEPAKDAGDIPGKMYHKGWRTFKGSRGQRWVYYNKGKTHPENIGQLYERGIVATKLDATLDPNINPKSQYLLDKYGYLIKSKIQKAENGAYYCSNKNGEIYKDTMVRYTNGNRYYFESDGKRATWKNSWHRCPGASNRYYYFDSIPGRVGEKKGWQKVVRSSGTFDGWYYFSPSGNHYMNKLTPAGYYLTKYGKLASGINEIDGRKYLFEVSDSNNRRGKMFKNKLVYHKGKWYYTGSNGVLRESGWQSVDGNWYYFDNYRAVTDRFMKKNGVNGYLDSSGKYTTGWVIVSNSNNKVRYIDPDGNGFAKNGSKWVDGLLYYFDSEGYRINDLTNIYTGPYYVEVDRNNGLMTVYNAAGTVPVKSIRVSVGNPWTPTPTGRYTLRRSMRWQPLMGPSWGQYGTHVSGAGEGGIFVHSVSGSSANSYSLPAGEYNKLGSPASHGCIRACVADAKWVYDNCNGARIYIFDGAYKSNEAMKGPLGRRALVPLRYPYNFDPTDPAI